MKKRIKDMTKQEKSARIERLSYEFYGINQHPSNLLYKEMQYAEPDEHISNSLKELEKLEAQQYKLTEQYSATVAREMAPLKRIFEYELAKLDEKYKNLSIQPKSFNPLNKFAKHSTDEAYRQELKELKARHNKTKNDIDCAARTDLDKCNEQIRTVFMNAINYLYR